MNHDGINRSHNSDGLDQEKRKKKIIRAIPVFLIILLALIFTGYKIYCNIQDEKNYYIGQVEYINYLLADDFDKFLGCVIEISTNLSANSEFEREYHKGLLNMHFGHIYNLNNMSNIKDYHIARQTSSYNQSFEVFLYDSSACVYELIDEKVLTEEQKDYLHTINHTYEELRCLRTKILEEYYSADPTERDIIFRRLFYDGEYAYVYVNKAYRIIDGVQSTVPTSKSKERDEILSNYD